MEESIWSWDALLLGLILSTFAATTLAAFFGRFMVALIRDEVALLPVALKIIEGGYVVITLASIIYLVMYIAYALGLQEVGRARPLLGPAKNISFQVWKLICCLPWFARLRLEYAYLRAEFAILFFYYLYHAAVHCAPEATGRFSVLGNVTWQWLFVGRPKLPDFDRPYPAVAEQLRRQEELETKWKTLRQKADQEFETTKLARERHPSLACDQNWPEPQPLELKPLIGYSPSAEILEELDLSIKEQFLLNHDGLARAKARMAADISHWFVCPNERIVDEVCKAVEGYAQACSRLREYYWQSALIPSLISQLSSPRKSKRPFKVDRNPKEPPKIDWSKLKPTVRCEPKRPVDTGIRRPVFRTPGIHQTASLMKTAHNMLKAEVVAGLQAERGRGSCS